MSTPQEHSPNDVGDEQGTSPSPPSSASSSPSPPDAVLQSSVLTPEVGAETAPSVSSEASNAAPEKVAPAASVASPSTQKTAFSRASPSSPSDGGGGRKGWKFSARASQKGPRGSFLGQPDLFQPKTPSSPSSSSSSPSLARSSSGKVELNHRQQTVALFINTLSEELPEFQDIWSRLPSPRQSSVVQKLLKSLNLSAEGVEDGGEGGEGEEKDNITDESHSSSLSPTSSPRMAHEILDSLASQSPRPQVPPRAPSRMLSAGERAAMLAAGGHSQSSFLVDPSSPKQVHRVSSMDSDNPLFAPGVLQEFTKKEFDQSKRADTTARDPLDVSLVEKTRNRSSSGPDSCAPELSSSGSTALSQPSASIQSFTTVSEATTPRDSPSKPKTQKFVGDQLQIWSCTVLKEVKILLQLYSKEIENPSTLAAGAGGGDLGTSGDSSSSSSSSSPGSFEDSSPISSSLEKKSAPPQSELEAVVIRLSLALKNVLLCVKDSVSDIHVDPTIHILENIKTIGTVDEKMIEAVKSERASVVSDVTNVVRKSFQKLSEETESLVVQLLSATFAEKSETNSLHANLHIISLTRELALQIGRSLDCLCTVTALRKLEKNTNSSSVVLQEESNDPSVNLGIWEDDPPSSEPHSPGTYTLNSLVKNLTSTESYDNNFVKTFIMTYRAFTSPWTLFNKLKERYDVPFGHLSDSATIQMRVCIVLKYWIENRSEDFDEQLVMNVRDFLTNKISVDNQEMGRRLLKTLEQAEANALSQQKISIPTLKFYTYNKQIHPPPWELLKNVSEVDVAKQLTLIDWDIFKTLDAPNFLNLAWDKPKYKHRALNLIRFIDRINRLSHWTASAIVTQETAAQRAEVITKLAKICKELLNLNNFHSFAGIIVGFNQAAISRLKFSFAGVHKRWRKEIEGFNTLIDPQKSYKNYRTALHAATPPSIPYIGVYLTDLTFIDEGNPNYVGNLINFSKQELVHDVLREVLVFQMESYNIPSIPNVASYFLALPSLDEDTLYKLSIEREPRGAKSVK